MNADSTLIQSSPETRAWLASLRDRLPDLEYKESRYYAAFRTELAHRVVAYLNPAKRSIRLFLSLTPTDDAHLKSTPSTSSWSARFPSVFTIREAKDLSAAVQLIGKSGDSVQALSKATPVLRPAHVVPEEMSSGMDFVEGAAQSIVVNAYERNRRARDRCIQHHGKNCTVCGFSFESRYGGDAAGYIQVHHIVPISTLRKNYRLNPITDLRPVCANCHAVIHRREPPFSIEEVKQMLREVN